MTDRKVFYVDVGDMSAKEARNCINKISGKDINPVGFCGIFLSFFTFNW